MRSLSYGCGGKAHTHIKLTQSSVCKCQIPITDNKTLRAQGEHKCCFLLLFLSFNPYHSAHFQIWAYLFTSFEDDDDYAFTKGQINLTIDKLNGFGFLHPSIHHQTFTKPLLFTRQYVK